MLVYWPVRVLWIWKEKGLYPSVNSACLSKTIFKSYPTSMVSSTVIVCSTQKEDRRILTNCKVNCLLIRMDCLLLSLSPHPFCLISLSLSLISCSVMIRGKNVIAVLAFHVVSERTISFSLAEGLSDWHWVKLGTHIQFLSSFISTSCMRMENSS